ncbi:MAG TPA: hypothetical protein VME67_03135 [Mycobacterium sp.]|nr:hypothetical protein [Mycobacterium sp.]HTX93913.1 hypothetical protein [Mycobacterium sp.]
MTTMTSITDNTAPGVVVGSVGQLLDAPEAGVARARPAPAGDSGPLERSPASVRREQFRTIDAQAARQFFAGAYRPGWRISGLASRSAVSHRRCEAGSMTMDEVMIRGRVAVEIVSVSHRNRLPDLAESDATSG